RQDVGGARGGARRRGEGARAQACGRHPHDPRGRDLDGGLRLPGFQRRAGARVSARRRDETTSSHSRRGAHRDTVGCTAADRRFRWHTGARSGLLLRRERFAAGERHRSGDPVVGARVAAEQHDGLPRAVAAAPVRGRRYAWARREAAPAWAQAVDVGEAALREAERPKNGRSATDARPCSPWPEAVRAYRWGLESVVKGQLAYATKEACERPRTARGCRATSSRTHGPRSPEAPRAPGNRTSRRSGACGEGTAWWRRTVQIFTRSNKSFNSRARSSSTCATRSRPCEWPCRCAIAPCGSYCSVWTRATA